MSGGSLRSREMKRSKRRLPCFGIHIGDAEAVADGGIGRGAAALAEDALLLAGEMHDVADGEEIGLVFEVPDDRQLMLDELPDALRHAAGIAFRRALPGEADKLVIGRGALARGFQRIIVSKLIEREAEPLEEAHRLGDRFGKVAKEPRHLGGAFHVPLGVGLEQPSGILQRSVLADAGQHVLQPAALGRVIEHVAQRQDGEAEAVGERGNLRQAAAVVATIAAACAKPHMAGKRLGERGERFSNVKQEGRDRLTSPLRIGGLPLAERWSSALPRPGEGVSPRVLCSPSPAPFASEGATPPQGGRVLAHGQHRHLQPLAPFDEVGEIEMALALLAAEIAGGEEAAEPSVGGAVGRPDRHVRRSVAEGEAAADRVAARRSSLAARWPRTIPASVFTSAMAKPLRPSAEAVVASSSGCEAPRRKEKFEAASNSA